MIKKEVEQKRCQSRDELFFYEMEDAIGSKGRGGSCRRARRHVGENQRWRNKGGDGMCDFWTAGETKEEKEKEKVDEEEEEEEEEENRVKDKEKKI
ncbi:hypothetical protein M0804_002601 [Polistes exclamans]|nr:hypothetical protein M0804_002601 [Polistes exclamans]